MKDYDLKAVTENVRQRRILEDFARHYEESGLGSLNRERPLWDCCANGETCWRGRHQLEVQPHEAGIPLPWIGPNYPKTGIAVLAMNLRNGGGLLREYETIAPEVNQSLRGGSKSHFGTSFHYRTGVMVDAVKRALDGDEILTELATTTDAADALCSSARLQLVKCCVNDKGRGNPQGPMRHLCTESYLRNDLELLSPRVLIIVHKKVQGSFWSEMTPEWHDDDGLSWGTFELNGAQVPVFAVHHPSSGTWSSKSWPALTERLKQLPPSLIRP